MYKYIGRGPVVRISRFQVTIIVITRVQSPVSRVQSPENTILTYTLECRECPGSNPGDRNCLFFFSFCNLAFCILHCVCVSVCAQRKEEIKSPIGTWHDYHGKMLVLMNVLGFHFLCIFSSSPHGRQDVYCAILASNTTSPGPCSAIPSFPQSPLCCRDSPTLHM